MAYEEGRKFLSKHRSPKNLNIKDHNDTYLVTESILFHNEYLYILLAKISLAVTLFSSNQWTLQSWAVSQKFLPLLLRILIRLNDILCLNFNFLFVRLSYAESDTYFRLFEPEFRYAVVLVKWWFI